MTTHQQKAFDMDQVVQYRDLEEDWEDVKIIGKNADGTYHVLFIEDHNILADVPAEFLRRMPWT